MTMPMPTITTNSTSRARLIGQQMNMLYGLREARTWILDAEPHQRDYPVENDWRAVITAHAERLRVIEKMISDIETLLEKLDKEGL